MFTQILDPTGNLFVTWLVALIPVVLLRADEIGLVAVLWLFADLMVSRGRVIAALRQQPRPDRVHPMRSAWWIAPFAIALGLEWWSRRRRGLA